MKRKKLISVFFSFSLESINISTSQANGVHFSHQAPCFCGFWHRIEINAKLCRERDWSGKKNEKKTCVLCHIVAHFISWLPPYKKSLVRVSEWSLEKNLHKTRLAKNCFFMIANAVRFWIFASIVWTRETNRRFMCCSFGMRPDKFQLHTYLVHMLWAAVAAEIFAEKKSTLFWPKRSVCYGQTNVENIHKHLMGYMFYLHISAHFHIYFF